MLFLKRIEYFDFTNLNTSLDGYFKGLQQTHLFLVKMKVSYQNRPILEKSPKLAHNAISLRIKLFNQKAITDLNGATKCIEKA